MKGFPFVTAKMQGTPGEQADPVGRRVDNQKLLDMSRVVLGSSLTIGCRRCMASG